MKLVLTIALLVVAVSACCFPKQWEGDIHTWNPLNEHFTRARRFYDFDNKLDRLDVRQNLHGHEETFTIIDLWNSSKRFIIDDTRKHCDLELLQGPMPEECIRPGEHRGDYYIGGSLEVQRYFHVHEGDVFVSITTKKDCVPVTHIFTTVKGQNRSDISEFENIEQHIRDPSVFTPPSFCPT